MRKIFSHYASGGLYAPPKFSHYKVRNGDVQKISYHFFGLLMRDV